MWYVDIVRNTDWVDSFKVNNENLVKLSYELFTGRLSKLLDEFNKNISKAKWLIDWLKWLFWDDSNFETKKDKKGNLVLSKEDKYLQEVALPKINLVLEWYAEQWKIDEQKFRNELSKISTEFISFMKWKTPKSNPFAGYLWLEATKNREKAAWL